MERLERALAEVRGSAAAPGPGVTSPGSPTREDPAARKERGGRVRLPPPVVPIRREPPDRSRADVHGPRSESSGSPERQVPAARVESEARVPPSRAQVPTPGERLERAHAEVRGHVERPRRGTESPDRPSPEAPPAHVERGGRVPLPTSKVETHWQPPGRGRAELRRRIERPGPDAASPASPKTEAPADAGASQGTIPTPESRAEIPPDLQALQSQGEEDPKGRGQEPRPGEKASDTPPGEATPDGEVGDGGVPPAQPKAETRREYLDRLRRSFRSHSDRLRRIAMGSNRAQDDATAPHPEAETQDVPGPAAEQRDAEAPEVVAAAVETPGAEDQHVEEPTAEHWDAQAREVAGPAAEKPEAEIREFVGPTAEQRDAQARDVATATADKPEAEARDGEKPTAQQRDAEAPELAAAGAEKPEAEAQDVAAPAAVKPEAEDRDLVPLGSEEPKAQTRDVAAPTARSRDAETREAQRPAAEPPEAKTRDAKRPKRRRRTKAEIRREHVERIRRAFRAHGDRLRRIAENPDSSQEHVRRWCLGVVRRVLGYRGGSIATEIQALDKAVDVALRIENRVRVVIECEDIHRKISPSAIDEVADYAVEFSADWVVITNGPQWCLYHVRSVTGAVPDVTRVFDISLSPVEGLSEAGAGWLYLLTRRAITSGDTERQYHRAACLADDRLLEALASDRAIQAIRRELAAAYEVTTGEKVSLEDLPVAERVRELLPTQPASQSSPRRS